MIGDVFLKAALPIIICRNMINIQGLMAITQMAAKESVLAVARKIELPEERQFKIFLGGLLLVKSVNDALAAIKRNTIPALELFRKRRKRHSRADESLASLLTEQSHYNMIRFGRGDAVSCQYFE
jgi:hypothetical protein